MCVTEAERVLRRALDREDMPYEPQVTVKTEHDEFSVDVLIARCIVVEVDGSTHFFQKDCFVKDRYKNSQLENQGFLVLRFRNIDVYKNMPYVLGKIRDAYSKILQTQTVEAIL
jgi:very-short-patch-repair endonuclease